MKDLTFRVSGNEARELAVLKRPSQKGTEKLRR